MTVLASVHLPPALTVPAGLAVLAWTLWYWARLGRPDVPRSRRWIRRLSLVAILVGLPAIVRASSFVDPAIEPRRYAEAWTVAVGALLALVLVAVVDAANSMRLHVVDRANLYRDHLLPRRRRPDNES